MTHDRLVYSFAAMPFVAFAAVGVYSMSADATVLALWALGYCVAYFLSRVRQAAYQADKERLMPEQFFERWRQRLKAVSGWHGLALTAPLLITTPAPSFEFTTIWCLTVAGIVAVNATHQTTVLAVYSRFLNCSWNVLTALSVLAFPQHWHFIGVTMLTYTFGIYRHTLSAHKFYLAQVRLEERTAKLAEQFKQAKEQAETALLEKDRFLATASHDLRQPVHAMGMLIQALMQRNKDPSLVPALQDLGNSVHTMSTMFNSLLDLSKLESGRSQLDIQDIDLHSLAQQVVALFQAQAQHSGLALRMHLPKRQAVGVADRALMQQILMNLLHNALRYTPKGGVLLALRAHGADWRLEVWDTGVGLPEDAASTIYQAYVRHPGVAAQRSPGYGLGLAVVERCATLMGLRFGMSSRLGRGSRFWVNVPRAGNLAGSSAPDWTLMSPPPSVSSQRYYPPINRGQCLIVEDDLQVIEAWRVMLSAWGVHAQYASHLAEALACVEAGYAPQVILCDENLRAGQSGFHLLKTLLARCPQAHGAMISGEFSSPALQAAEEEGYLVLKKPVDTALLHDLLSRWILESK